MGHSADDMPPATPERGHMKEEIGESALIPDQFGWVFFCLKSMAYRGA